MFDDGIFYVQQLHLLLNAGWHPIAGYEASNFCPSLKLSCENILGDVGRMRVKKRPALTTYFTKIKSEKFIFC